MTKSVLFVLALLSFNACKQNANSNKSEGNMTNPSDSIVAQWEKVWNANDSAGISEMLSDDAQFISEGISRYSKDTISNTFIKKYYKLIRNLQTKTIKTDVNENVAYYFGTYSHDVQLPDTLIKDINGNFSFIIEKSEPGWKLKVIDIEENVTR
jgi:ketosteroid isomerase-like protein